MRKKQKRTRGFANDPAAEFGAALAINEAYLKVNSHLTGEPNLSDVYEGHDEFMRRVMTLARAFETWCCRHVDWKIGVDDCWAYFLEDRLGPHVFDEFGFAGLPDTSVFRLPILLPSVDRSFRRIARKLKLPLLRKPTKAKS